MEFLPTIFEALPISLILVVGSGRFGKYFAGRLN